MFAAAKDISKLLEGVPNGAWVAVSHDETRLVAFAAELQAVLQKSKQAGEDYPVIVRVPETGATTLLL
jgi:hypothetical protein